MGRKISCDEEYSRKCTLERKRGKDKEKATGEARNGLLGNCLRRLYIPTICRQMPISYQTAFYISIVTDYN